MCKELRCITSTKSQSAYSPQSTIVSKVSIYLLLSFILPFYSSTINFTSISSQPFQLGLTRHSDATLRNLLQSITK